MNAALETLALPSEAVLKLGIPHVTEYFGLWCMEPQALCNAVESHNAINLAAHVAAAQPGQMPAPSDDARYPIVGNGVAVIDLRGTLMKFTGSLGGGTSTVFARRQLRQAANDQQVKSILLRVDSPGGTVSGTRDLADDVAAVNKRKTVIAYAEDLAASAAYWVISQASEIYVNPTGMIGSIGTYGVIADQSVRAAQLGISVHVVRAGKFKGMGEAGTPVTEEQLQEYQRIVNELNEHFLAAVARGRSLSLSAVRELADGTVKIGRDATSAGLVDGVKTLDEVLRISSRKPQAAQAVATQETTAMNENENVNAGGNEATPPQAKSETPALVAASVDEIKAACPGASADFILGCVEKQMTLAQAKDGFIALQSQQLAAKDEALAAEQRKTPPATPPLADVPTGGSSDLEGAADYVSAVDELIRQGKPRVEAVIIAQQRFPEQHRAYVMAHNAQHGRKTEDFERNYN